MIIDDELLRARLADVPESWEPKPGLRKAAVLAPLLRRDGVDHLLCTRRLSSLRHHAGQISFPGGRKDGEETPIETALRETHEEVRIAPTEIEVLGALPARFSVAGFWVHPIVGRVAPEAQPVADPSEVARIVLFPFDRISTPEAWDERPPSHGRSDRRLPHLDHDGEVLWGLTARFALDLADCISSLER